MKVLVIEDEPKVAAFIKEGLESHHYDVELAFDGQIGQKLAINKNFDIIIIDIIIPYINGLELCKSIRTVNPHIPLLMLTALGTTEDKLAGFDSGADDYLVKPFAFKELIARIKSLTRRASGVTQTSSAIRISDLELNLDTKIAKRGEKQIALTAKEFSLLEYFMRNKGKVLSRVDIAEKVWDLNFETGTNVVDVYVNFLRKKIDRDYPNKLIHTHIGLGYVFKEV